MRTLQISSEGLLIQGFGRRDTEALADAYLPLAVSWAQGNLRVQKIGFANDADTGDVTTDTGEAAKHPRR